MIIQELEIFKRAHIFTLYMYKITKNFPKDEMYGLISQIKRASGSINANLMEGAARKTNKEFEHFIHISRGSVQELIYHIMLSRDLEYIKNDIAEKCIDELQQLGKMLNGLLNNIKE
ncbi:MAG: four helix bundle protein [Rickettsiales bacterium]|jgi:four helix bundle protein|nr:four helix bundle protein [Rickettsiales bacterium]